MNALKNIGIGIIVCLAILFYFIAIMFLSDLVFDDPFKIHDMMVIFIAIPVALYWIGYLCRYVWSKMN